MAEQHVGSGNGSGAALGSVNDAVDPIVEAITAAGKAAAAESAGDPKVIAAIELGWLMTELTAGWYPDPLVEGLVLDDAGKCQVQALRLKTLLGTLNLPELDAQAVERVVGTLHVGPATADAAELKVKLGVALMGADARLPEAFTLGGGLRALTPGPGPSQGAASQVAPGASSAAPDPQRLIGALDSLSSALPSHAARSVANSLGAWPQSQASKNAVVTAAQVRLWRSVIVGEKKGTELLEPDDYLKAARQLEIKFARRALTSRWLWGVALVAVALFGAGLYFLFAAHGQPGRVAAGTTGVLAAAGLSWKGIGGTVGKLIGKIEVPLWGAELDTAITDAITLTGTVQNGRPDPTVGLRYADRSGRAFAKARASAG